MTLNYTLNDDRVNRSQPARTLIVNLKDHKLEVISPKGRVIFSINFANNEIYFNNPSKYTGVDPILRLKSGWMCTYELIENNCDCGGQNE